MASVVVSHVKIAMHPPEIATLAAMWLLDGLESQPTGLPIESRQAVELRQSKHRPSTGLLGAGQVDVTLMFMDIAAYPTVEIRRKQKFGSDLRKAARMVASNTGTRQAKTQVLTGARLDGLTRDDAASSTVT